jgi:hypothetical protein
MMIASYSQSPVDYLAFMDMTKLDMMIYIFTKWNNGENNDRT